MILTQKLKAYQNQNILIFFTVIFNQKSIWIFEKNIVNSFEKCFTTIKLGPVLGFEFTVFLLRGRAFYFLPRSQIFGKKGGGSQISCKNLHVICYHFFFT